METCEDRDYRCYETLTPPEHAAKYGYAQSGYRSWWPEEVTEDDETAR